jgi:hypothetical protein
MNHDEFIFHCSSWRPIVYLQDIDTTFTAEKALISRGKQYKIRFLFSWKSPSLCWFVDGPKRVFLFNHPLLVPDHFFHYSLIQFSFRLLPDQTVGPTNALNFDDQHQHSRLDTSRSDSLILSEGLILFTCEWFTHINHHRSIFPLRTAHLEEAGEAASI